MISSNQNSGSLNSKLETRNTEHGTFVNNMTADTSLLTRVEDALSQIRPYLEADNGDVSLLGITDELVVMLRFHGACRSCSMSAMTLKAGIEQTILRMVPEIKGVKAVEEADELSS
jgi:Fe-S cluster biogenesis protein NfuA